MNFEFLSDGLDSKNPVNWTVGLKHVDSERVHGCWWVRVRGHLYSCSVKTGLKAIETWASSHLCCFHLRCSSISRLQAGLDWWVRRWTCVSPFLSFHKQQRCSRRQRPAVLFSCLLRCQHWSLLRFLQHQCCLSTLFSGWAPPLQNRLLSPFFIQFFLLFFRGVLCCSRCHANLAAWCVFVSTSQKSGESEPHRQTADRRTSPTRPRLSSITPTSSPWDGRRKRKRKRRLQGCVHGPQRRLFSCCPDWLLLPTCDLLLHQSYWLTREKPGWTRLSGLWQQLVDVTPEGAQVHLCQHVKSYQVKKITDQSGDFS